MEYLLDSVNKPLIERCFHALPVKGVTSNPSIIKKEGRIEFFAHFKEIRQIIGPKSTLHVQVIGEDYDHILQDAQTILEKIGKDTYIKIPVTEAGLAAIKTLKAQRVNITATAVYTKMQGLLAVEAGSDYIAPYFNRMENIGVDPQEAISLFAEMIDKYNYHTKILAASFKNIGQINSALQAGAQGVTADPSLLLEAFNMPSIQKAVQDFKKDWESIYGEEVAVSSL